MASGLQCLAPSLQKVNIDTRSRQLPRQQLPEDVVGAVLFLLSDEAAFVTGTVLPVNGGFVMS